MQCYRLRHGTLVQSITIMADVTTKYGIKKIFRCFITEIDVGLGQYNSCVY